MNAPTRPRLLVLTDHTDWCWQAINSDSVLLISFDAEVVEVLREQGAIVRNSLDYDTVQPTSLQTLFQNYGDDSINECSICDPHSGMPVPRSVVSKQLAFKAVEVYAPILWVWEMVERIVAVEAAQAIRIEIQNPWFRTVIGNIVAEIPIALER